MFATPIKICQVIIVIQDEQLKNWSKKLSWKSNSTFGFRKGKIKIKD